MGIKVDVKKKKNGKKKDCIFGPGKKILSLQV